jgi:hypothetical protein
LTAWRSVVNKPVMEEWRLVRRAPEFAREEPVSHFAQIGRERNGVFF